MFSQSGFCSETVFFFLFILYFGDSKKQYHCNAEKGNRKNSVKKTFGKKGHFTD